MRGTKAEGGFFALKDTNMLDDYVKLFGETDGVKADASAIGKLHSQ